MINHVNIFVASYWSRLYWLILAKDSQSIYIEILDYLGDIDNKMSQQTLKSLRIDSEIAILIFLSDLSIIFRAP